MVATILMFAVTFCSVEWSYVITGYAATYNEILMPDNTGVDDWEDISDTCTFEEEDTISGYIIEEQEEKRDQYTRYFTLSDGSSMAAVYPKAISYLVDGEWIAIDNTLNYVEEGEDGYYVTEDSPIQVQIAENSNSEDLVMVSSNNADYVLIWGLGSAEVGTGNIGVSTGEGTLSENNSSNEASHFQLFGTSTQDGLLEQEGISNVADSGMSEEIESKDFESFNLQEAAVDGLTAGGSYVNILPNIDIQYIVDSTTLKENVVLKTKDADLSTVSFQLQHEGLEVREECDGSISFIEEETQEVIFTFKAPYMIDSNGEEGNISYVLEEIEDTLYISFQVEEEWLTDSSRAYPVVIDPITETSVTESIKDTYVTENYPTTNYAGYGEAVVGYETSVYGKCRYYLALTELPELSPGDAIYSAKVYVTQSGYSTWSTTTYPLIAVQPKTSWAKTITWDTQPELSASAVSAVNITENNGSYVQRAFDVTKIIRQWYADGANNTGLCIHGADETDKTKVTFCAVNWTGTADSSLVPTGVFYFRNALGTESYWSFHEQDGKDAGVGYTCDFNGNLVFVHEDHTTSSCLLGATVSHVYNAVTYESNSIYGAGWQLSVSQTLKATSSAISAKGYPYVYKDSDGTSHYFYTNENGELVDEDGLGLILEQVSDGSSSFVMKDSSDKEYTFNSNGNLIQERDTEGNKVTYTYETVSGVSRIVSAVDASNNIIQFVYNTNGKLWKIIDSANRTITYQYTGEYLTSITSPDGTSCYYEYNSEGMLSATQSSSGYRLEYDYTEVMGVPQVSKIQEYTVEGTGKTAGQSMGISYPNVGTTVFTACGEDGNLDTSEDNLVTTYEFNSKGETVCVYDEDGNAASYEYYSSGAKNHKLSVEGTMQSTVVNLANNGGFAKSIEWSGTIISGGTVSWSSDYGYADDGLVKIVKTDADDKDAIYQLIVLEPGVTYTLSAYVKVTEMESSTGGVYLRAALFGSDATSDANKTDSVYVTDVTDSNIDNGWRKLSVTFTADPFISVRIEAGMEGATGTAYIDNLQLEKGAYASDYNIIDNAGFECIYDSEPYRWANRNLDTSVGDGLYTSNSENIWQGSKSIAITGEIQTQKYVAHTVYVEGDEDETFTLSGWAKIDALEGRFAELAAAFVYTDGTAKWEELKFNAYETDWQYVSGVISADDGDETTNKEFTRIDVYIFYYNQYNTAYFDGIQLVKDNATMYYYNDDGNITEVEEGEESQTYEYDSEGNLISFTDAEGNDTSYSYGTTGSLEEIQTGNTNVTIESDKESLTDNVVVSTTIPNSDIVSGETYYIRQKLSGKYLTAGSSGVTQSAKTSSSSQKWTVESVSKDKVVLVNGDGTYLTTSSATVTAGTTLTTATSSGATTQKFKISMEDSGFRILSSVDETYCISNSTSSTGSASLTLQECTEGNEQLWYFESVDSTSASPEAKRTYHLRFVGSGMYLGVNTDETAIVQQYFAGSDCQKFTLVDAGSGLYYLEVSETGKVLYVSSTLSNGYAVLSLREKTESASEKFSFTKLSDGSYRLVNDSTAVCNYNNAISEGGAVILAQSSASFYTAGSSLVLEETSVTSSTITYTENQKQVATQTDSMGNTVTYGYDENGRLNTSVTDVNGTTLYTYNTLNDLLTSQTHQYVDETGTNSNTNLTVSYGYTDGNLTSITRNGFTYTYEYDGFGNLLSVQVGSTDLVTNEYGSNNGELQSVTYGNGKKVSYQYDKKGNITEVLWDNTTIAEYAYDSSGNLYSMTDNLTGETTYYYYDFNGNLVAQDGSVSIRYGTNPETGNDYEVYTVDGFTVKTEVENSLTGSMAAALLLNGQEVAKYRYNSLGSLEKKILPEAGDYTITYTYKAGSAGSLVESITNGDTTITYTYDNAGNITTITEGTTLQHTYTYDSLNQLVRDDDAVQGITFVYTYDGGGNITSVKKYAYTTGSLTGITATATITYVYGDTNWKDLITSWNGQNITYDGAGNALAWRDGMSFTWGAGNRLTSLTSTDTTATYTYNADSLRTAKTVNGVTTTYILNGSNIITLKQGTDRIDFYYDESGNLFGFRYDEADYYYIKNVQGDVIGIIDENGTEVVSYEYDTWGKLLETSGTKASTLGKLNPFRYRGYCYDEESGLYYLQSRYYDPVVGRFVSADDVAYLGATGSVLSYNLYAYCENNAVNYSDPFGYAKINIKWVSDVINILIIVIPALYTISKCLRTMSKSASLIAQLGSLLNANWNLLISKLDDWIYWNCATTEGRFILSAVVAGGSTVISIILLYTDGIGGIVEYILDVLDGKWDGYLDTSRIKPKICYSRLY